MISHGRWFLSTHTQASSHLCVKLLSLACAVMVLVASSVESITRVELRGLGRLQASDILWAPFHAHPCVTLLCAVMALVAPSVASITGVGLQRLNRYRTSVSVLSYGGWHLGKERVILGEACVGSKPRIHHWGGIART